LTTVCRSPIEIHIVASSTFDAAASMLTPPHHQSPSPVAAWAEGAVQYVQLARPERSNAYTQEMLSELLRQVECVDEDEALRVLVVTGAGERTFCAGADRHELKTRSWQSTLSLFSARVFHRLRACRKVTIAAVNGSAVGGGLELALACDLRIASQDARFWLPEPELGLLPAAGGTQWLPALVGPGRAKELILAGAVWSADEACRYGLVNEVVPLAELADRVRGWCGRILKRDALALQLAKQAIHAAACPPPETNYELLAQALLVREQRRGDDGHSADPESAKPGA
jgi:enoyl-CoA hydratase